jgi:uncharacterized membrane protein
MIISLVALELLRRKSSFVLANTEYQHFKSRTQALREFNKQAITERSKFEQENTHNDLGQKGGPKATMAVVTLILAIDGDNTKTTLIQSAKDVEETLRKIATDSLVDNCLQSAEILWTPEDRSETLSLRDIIADYPELRAV